MDIVEVLLAALLGFLVGFELKEYLLKRKLSQMIRSKFGGKEWKRKEEE